MTHAPVSRFTSAIFLVALLVVAGVGSALFSLAPAVAQTGEGAVAPPPAVVATPAEGDLAPMPDIPGIGVAWPSTDGDAPGDEPPQPNMAPPPPITVAAPDAGTAQTPTLAIPTDSAAEALPNDARDIADDGSEKRYVVQLTGVDDIADSAFRDRFNNLSLL
ncbi:MAG: hypothetical protein ABI395_09050, partial [Sphingobium sp.]